MKGERRSDGEENRKMRSGGHRKTRKIKVGQQGQRWAGDEVDGDDDACA